MKIIVDDKIPYIREKLAMLTDDVVYLRGADINAEDVRDADALIVRTRTRCNRQLLEGSKVQFVATATIGFDHIDTNYMVEAGIKYEYGASVATDEKANWNIGINVGFLSVVDNAGAHFRIDMFQDDFGTNYKLSINANVKF